MSSSQKNKVREFIIENIPQHPTDIVARAMEHFKITRPAVHKHLNFLIKDGQIHKEGTTKSIQYSLLNKKAKVWKIKINPDLQEDRIWEKYIEPDIKPYPENIQRICQYGFTEMMNNVIDHSGATDSIISLNLDNNIITMMIQDNGIGIFKKIQNALSLPDIKESLLHLSKGKFTTDPSRHTGEGIFFTSRVFDEFSIASNQLEYLCFSKDQDWLIQTLKSGSIQGTRICMKLSQDSNTVLDRVFKEYTDSEYSFNKTNVFVKLAKLKGEKYISRSQAKRLVLGLDKFKKVILDFQEVPAVGQAFVDEVFRVFQNAHPEIEIEYINANEDVEFMIQRGLSVTR